MIELRTSLDILALVNRQGLSSGAWRARLLLLENAKHQACSDGCTIFWRHGGEMQGLGGMLPDLHRACQLFGPACHRCQRRAARFFCSILRPSNSSKARQQFCMLALQILPATVGVIAKLLVFCHLSPWPKACSRAVCLALAF